MAEGKEQADHQDIHSSKSVDNTTPQQDPVGRQEPMAITAWSHWRGLLPYQTTEWREGTSDAGQQCSQGVWTYTNCSVRLTTTSRRPSGARTSPVNTVDTTAGGRFSGSLKRCCRHTKRRRALELAGRDLYWQWLRQGLSRGSIRLQILSTSGTVQSWTCSREHQLLIHTTPLHYTTPQAK